MKPKIDRSKFGSITLDGDVFEHDVVVRLSGRVDMRDRALSKDVYGTSHVISLAEAKHVFEEGAESLIVGAGRYGRVKLSPEAAEYFEERGCQVQLLPMRRAVKAWNRAEGAVIGLFHISC
ncbi:MAG: hypothetical protein E3J64_08160 [Anaerolineales bacterium]|nr:MAG: hypothetical protein E3J64_08160 [Anaerolineales bacterium]